eukprot:1099215-Rhodomonas_salina.1
MSSSSICNPASSDALPASEKAPGRANAHQQLEDALRNQGLASTCPVLQTRCTGVGFPTQPGGFKFKPEFGPGDSGSGSGPGFGTFEDKGHESAFDAGGVQALRTSA